MYKLYSTGARTEPCGTPAATFLVEESSPSTVRVTIFDQSLIWFCSVRFIYSRGEPKENIRCLALDVLYCWLRICCRLLYRVVPYQWVYMSQYVLNYSKNELRSGLRIYSFITKATEKSPFSGKFLIIRLEFVPNIGSCPCYRERSFLKNEDFSMYVYIYIYKPKKKKKKKNCYNKKRRQYEENASLRSPSGYPRQDLDRLPETEGIYRYGLLTQVCVHVFKYVS
jgi:hypothetical protein